METLNNHLVSIPRDPGSCIELLLGYTACEIAAGNVAAIMPATRIAWAEMLGCQL